MNVHHNDDHFDTAMREHYRQAAARVPGPLRLQLTPAIAAQRSRPASSNGRRLWPAATAFASLALAIGLWWSPAMQKTPAGPPVGLPAVADTAAIDDANDDTELLARNPDFYAWLGSDEARSLAME